MVAFRAYIGFHTSRMPRVPAVLLVGLWLGAPAADAATTTTTFAVSANVASGCSISAATLAFGSYSGAVNDSSTSVTVLCTSGTPYNVGLNAGTGTGASVATRKMTSGLNTLSYSLYSNTGRTTVWGNTVGTDTVSGTFVVGQQPLTVYGRIAASQIVAPGSYTDTITVTITY